MKSPKQFRPKSTPKTVALEGGIKMSTPMATGRSSHKTKTMPRLYNHGCCR